VLIIHRSRYFL